jgi:hypothetical protein
MNTDLNHGEHGGHGGRSTARRGRKKLYSVNIVISDTADGQVTAKIEFDKPVDGSKPPTSDAVRLALEFVQLMADRSSGSAVVRKS